MIPSTDCASPTLFRAVVTSSLAAACLLFAGPARAQSVADLDEAGTLPWCTAYGIDGTGRAVGAGIPSGSSQVLPVRFEGGVATLLPLLPGDEDGYAFGINDVGVVVGSSTITLPDGGGGGTTTESHPVVWTGGVAIDLRTLVTVGDPGGLEAALGITDSGTFLASGVEPVVGALRGFVIVGGVLTDLGALNGAPTGRTYPSHIVGTGAVVGGSESAGGDDHAFRWEDGVMTDLHTLAGIAGSVSRAYDGNRFGVVCGAADFIADASHAMTAAVWVGDTAIDLGHLGGGQSLAAGINDLGTVVGTSFLPGGTSTAFRWTGDAVEDLNALLPPGSGWQLASAEDVDDEGRVVGVGIHDGAARPYVLTPDCSGGYSIYGAGCAGTGGVVPTLAGVACPTPGETFALAVDAALPGALGVLCVGSGTDSLAIKPNCQLQVMPLVLEPLFVPVDGDGALFLPTRLPRGTAPFTVNLQFLVADAGASFGVASTNALRLDLR